MSNLIAATFYSPSVFVYRLESPEAAHELAKRSAGRVSSRLPSRYGLPKRWPHPIANLIHVKCNLHIRSSAPWDGTFHDSLARTALAHSSELCGFWPVTRLPSTQHFEFQSSPFSYFAPSSMNFDSIKKGTLPVCCTAASSLLLKPVTVMSLTSGSPDGLTH